MAAGDKNFGSCCELLKDAMSDQDFDPLITVGEDDGILYLSVGLIDVEEEQPGSVDGTAAACAEVAAPATRVSARVAARPA